MSAPEPPSRPSTIGLLEASSLARGLLGADAALKEAAVELVWSRTIEPGHHLTLLGGEVDAVRSALRRGRVALGEDFLADLFLARTAAPVLDALLRLDEAETEPAPTLDEAVGLLECAHVSGTLLAADAALKHAAVTLVRLRFDRNMAGRGLVVLTGETSDVEGSVDAAARRAEERHALLRAEVICGPHPLLPQLIADL